MVFLCAYHRPTLLHRGAPHIFSPISAWRSQADQARAVPSNLPLIGGRWPAAGEWPGGSTTQGAMKSGRSKSMVRWALAGSRRRVRRAAQVTSAALRRRRSRAPIPPAPAASRRRCGRRHARASWWPRPGQADPAVCQGRATRGRAWRRPVRQKARAPGSRTRRRNRRCGDRGRARSRAPAEAHPAHDRRPCSAGR